MAAKITDTSTSVHRKQETSSSKCEICRAPAHYSYLSVMSCQPCKMFFKRNAMIGQAAFKCNFDNHCEIDVANRRTCTSCRLAKCFTAGMNTGMLRSSHSPRKNQTNRPKDTKIIPTIATYVVDILDQHLPSQFPTINLSQSSNSLMSTSQWTLLSKLIHSYDEQKIFLVIQRLMNEHNALQFTQRMDQSSIQDFITVLYETTQIFILSNTNLCALLSNDHSELLRNAVDSVICFGSAFILSQSVIDADFWNMLATKYGIKAMIFTSFVIKLVDPDVVLVKLGLCLLACSQNSSLFSPNVSHDQSNASAIFHIQNMYTELTWKYLLYKYDHHQAVMRFFNLIQCLMAATVAMCHLQGVQTHVDDIESLVETIELKLALNDIEEINENIS